MWAEAVMQRKGKTAAIASTTAAATFADGSASSSSSAIAVLAAATIAQTTEEELKLETTLTWQTVTRLRALKLPPWTRTAAAALFEQADAAAGAFKQLKAVAAAAAAAAPESSARAQMAAWTAAIAALGTSEHWALSQEHKVALLDLLVEAAYSTKKVATVLQANMTDRLQLEAQRREEKGRMSREAKEELAIKKERITTELKEAAAKAFEAETAAAATPAGTGTAAKGKGKGKAAAVTADKAGSSAKEGGKELAEPKAVSYHEVHKHLEALLEHEAVGIGPFKVRDIIAEDAAAATDAATAAGDSSSAAAAAGDGRSSDVEECQLFIKSYSH
eukprot:6924-Heterococcus_DN1.PRE.2